jgi:hypothetical protein
VAKKRARNSTATVNVTPGAVSRVLEQPKQKHNLLLFNDPDKKNPYSHWQSEVDRLTKKPLPPSPKDVGFAPSEAELKKVHSEKPKNLAKELPPEFCPYCPPEKGNDVPATTGKARGMFIFRDAHPELKIEENATIMHYMCEPCAKEVFFPSRKTLLLPDRWWDDQKQSEHKLVESRIIDYIKSQRAKGVTGSIFGSEERIERFKHLEDEDDQE